ncbi:MAG: 4Fe-4S binding protein [Candidatus Methanofastidiosia archaeon]
MRSVWITNIIKKGFPFRFFLAKLTKVPLLNRIMEYLFFEGDDMLYILKDAVIQVNQAVEPGSMVIPSQIVEYFIRKANYLWIMNTCICRESAQCTDYPVELGCLFLGEAAMGINPELGRKVTRDQALEHVKKCREQGLVHLIGRNKLDAVWLNVGPGNKLLTVCNCCPCCCLWRMLPDLKSDIGSKVKKMPGVTVTVNNVCTGCGVCTDVCFVNAITIKDGKAVISEQCRGCGRCASVCPQNAIEVTIEDGYIETSINRISELVDIT